MKRLPPIIASFLIAAAAGSPVLLQPDQYIYETPKTVKIILAGDIMLDRGVEYMIKKYATTTENALTFPFLKIADYLKTADIVSANLEGPISDKGEKVGSIYSFRADPSAVEGLKYAGINLVSVANNHAFDYGRLALKDTMTRLAENGISYAGAGFSREEAYSPAIKEVQGIKIGFLSYTDLGAESWKATENNSGIAWVNRDNLDETKEGIKSAKEKVDILIVSLHSGEEYQKTPNQFQIDFSRMAIDAGADLVASHHPHVTQGNEIYQGKHIFYSLGNFIFDQSFSEDTMKGQVVEVTIQNKEINKTELKETKINAYFQTEI